MFYTIHISKENHPNLKEGYNYSFQMSSSDTNICWGVAPNSSNINFFKKEGDISDFENCGIDVAKLCEQAKKELFEIIDEFSVNNEFDEYQCSEHYLPFQLWQEYLTQKRANTHKKNKEYSESLSRR